MGTVIRHDFSDPRPRRAQAKAAPAKPRFVLRIDIEGVEPVIWRRVEVADMTLVLLCHKVNCTLRTRKRSDATARRIEAKE